MSSLPFRTLRAPMLMDRRNLLRLFSWGAVGACCAPGGSHIVQPARGSALGNVTVAGQRVRTVDMHAHCIFPEAMELMRSRSTRPVEWGINTRYLEQLSTPASRLTSMDEQGIDVAALSINPFWYSAERDLAERVVQLQNGKLAELCSAHPDRFVAFAAVALQYPALAAEQLEEGIRKYRLRGAAILGSVNGEELSAPRFHPFWDAAERLGALIFIHPRSVPELRARLQGNGLLSNVIGNPLDTTIALSHLIFEGTLDRFPGLKICAAHAGGFLPSYSARSDYGCLTFPEDCTGIRLKKRPSEYLRQLYFDSLIFTSEGLRHLVAECGASQVVMGTDYPYPWTQRAVHHILDTNWSSAADKRAMLGGTASRLLAIGQ
jgi:aminocarboxymuconate-semialdehyde decarboxylase